MGNLHYLSLPQQDSGKPGFLVAKKLRRVTWHWAPRGRWNPMQTEVAGFFGRNFLVDDLIIFEGVNSREWRTFVVNPETKDLLILEYVGGKWSKR